MIQLSGMGVGAIQHSSQLLQSIDTNNADEILKVLNGNTSELEPVDIGWLYSILGRIFINSDQSKSLEYYTKAKEVFMQIEIFLWPLVRASK